MFDYTNSLNNNFNKNIYLNKNSAEKEPSAAQTQQDSAEKTSSAYTVDYNVTVPSSYTKLGVSKLSNGQEIHSYKLSNGQKVYIAPKQSAMTTLNTYVNTGSINESDDQRGISHFLEHMAFNGTKGTDNYFKLSPDNTFSVIDKMGGYANASTGFAETNYTISIPQYNKDDFETVVKMQSAMMNNMELSQTMVEKEHGPVTSEISMYADVPDTIVRNCAIKNLYNINSSSKDLIAGTVDNILNVDSNKVNQYYKNNYYPSNMATVVTGDVNPDEAIEIIAKNFRGQNPVNPQRRVEPLKPIDKTVRQDIFSDKAVGTSGFICFNGPEFNNLKDMVALNAANYILFNKKNSIVETDLKKYNVSAFAESEKISTSQTDGRLLEICYDSTEENSEIALKSIFNNLANFAAPTQQQLDSIKDEMRIVNEKAYENMTDLNYAIGNSAIMGGVDNVVDEMKVIDSLTVEDVVNAVHKYYDINKASVAIIHPDTTNIDSVNKNYNNAHSVSFKGTHIQDSQKPLKQPLNTQSVLTYDLNNSAKTAVFNTNSSVSNYLVGFTTKIPPNVKPGAVKVLSSMLSKKADNYQDFIDNNNIAFTIDVSENSILFGAEVPSKNLNPSMDLMKDLVLNPDFSQENFEIAKEKLKNYLSVTPSSASDNVLKEVFPDSPRGYTDKDVAENIDNLTLADVVGLYSYIMKDHSVISTAGLPLEKHPESKAVFDNQISSLPASKPLDNRVFNDYKPIERTKVVKDAANVAQADIVEVFKFHNDNSIKSKAVYSVLNDILSSGEETGLFNNLREKEKLAYSVYSDYENSDYSSSTLQCHIKTTTDGEGSKTYDNVQRSINGFNRQIQKLKNGEFTDDELETAKLQFKTSLLKRVELQEHKVYGLYDMLNGAAGNINEINEMYNLVDSLTKEDIVEGANHIFSTKPVYSIRASNATIDANKQFFDDLEK